MRVMSIDPGITSGYTFAHVSLNGVEFYPFEMQDDVDALWNRLERFDPKHIVMESFEFRQARTGIELFPVQLIGVARLYVKQKTESCEIHMQTAHQGKGFYTDGILKSKNLYKRALPHGVDATRHLLHWLTFGSGFQYCPSSNFSLLERWDHR